MTRRISHDDIDRLHDYGLHVPTRTIFLETPANDDGNELGVGYAMAQRVVKNLRLLDHAGYDPITLVINTEGGCVFHGMGIYDAIRSCRSHVKGLVIGQACSMGSVILQACDERVTLPHATVMYHAGTMDGAGGAPFQEGKRATDYEFRFGERLDRIVFARIQVARPHLTWNKFRIECDRGIYCTAEDAVTWGLIDSIQTEE